MRRLFLAIGVLAALAALSLLTSNPVLSGVTMVACELPVGYAGKKVDLAGQSQAPCYLVAEVLTKRQVFWFFGIYSKSRIDPIIKPAKDMFAYIAAGTSLFPAERTEYCASGMVDFIINNKSLLEDQARRQNSNKFTVSCTEEANV